MTNTNAEVIEKCLNICKLFVLKYPQDKEAVRLLQAIDEARMCATQLKSEQGGDWTCPDCCVQPCNCKFMSDGSIRKDEPVTETVPQSSDTQTALREVREALARAAFEYREIELGGKPVIGFAQQFYQALDKLDRIIEEEK
jgi:hypothetical protein